MTPLLRRLSRPVDGASLAVFRIAFGLTLLGEVIRYFAHDWIARYYILPRFHFSYFGFDWIRPWAGVGMYAHFGLLGFFALMVALGALYRATSVLLWLTFTYVFFLDQARYGNQFYAASLFALLLAVVPAHHAYSLHGVGSGRRPNRAVPLWSVWLIRAQTAVIYVFSGITKLNADWLRGEPMRGWLVERSSASPLLEPIVANKAILMTVSYGALAFDFLVVPALLWRRTRPLAFAAVVAFQIVNAKLFPVGMLPWLMIVASTVFFDPGWPHVFRRIVERVNGGTPSPRPAFDASRPGKSVVPTLRPALAIAIAIYLILQISIPARRALYPAGVRWTNEGRIFTWETPPPQERYGWARFLVTDPANGRTTVVEPSAVLEDWQTSWLVGRPDMVLQLAHYIAAVRDSADRRVAVRAEAHVTVDRHESRSLLDPTIDLAREPRTFWPAAWITRGR